MERSLVLLAVAACAASGCGRAVDRSIEASPLSICSGDPGLEMGALVLGGGLIYPGMQVMLENGTPFVYVDGTCRFWAWTFANHGWNEVRTGVLDRDAEHDLAVRLQYGSWPAWAGHDYFDTSVFDGGVLVLIPDMSIEREITCYGLCVDEAIPAPLRAVAADLRDVATDLWAAGEPVTGDVRYVVVLGEGDPVPATHYDWPLSFEPSSVAITEGEAYLLGEGGGRVASGADAEALRALRATYRQTAMLVPQIPVKDSAGRWYKLFFRDTIPYEDERGLIRPE
jgi:hypothetical protein